MTYQIVKNKIMKKILIKVALVVVLWVAISNSIQAFKCPKMSQTELFIHIHKSFICDWNNCE